MKCPAIFVQIIEIENNEMIEIISHVCIFAELHLPFSKEMWNNQYFYLYFHHDHQGLVTSGRNIEHTFQKNSK